MGDFSSFSSYNNRRRHRSHRANSSSQQEHSPQETSYDRSVIHSNDTPQRTLQNSDYSDNWRNETKSYYGQPVSHQRSDAPPELGPRANWRTPLLPSPDISETLCIRNNSYGQNLSNAQSWFNTQNIRTKDTRKHSPIRSDFHSDRSSCNSQEKKIYYNKKLNEDFKCEVLQKTLKFLQSDEKEIIWKHYSNMEDSFIFTLPSMSQKQFMNKYAEQDSERLFKAIQIELQKAKGQYKWTPIWRKKNNKNCLFFMKQSINRAPINKEETHVVMKNALFRNPDDEPYSELESQAVPHGKYTNFTCGTQHPEAEESRPRAWVTGPTNGRPERFSGKHAKIMEALSKPVESTKAERMMQLMGWKGGALGTKGEGIVVPIMPNITQLPGAGFGHKPDGKKGKRNKEEERRKQRNQRKQQDVKKLNKSTKQNFKTNVLTELLNFVRNDKKLEICFDVDLTNAERKCIHKLVECIREGQDFGYDSVHQMELVRDIQSGLRDCFLYSESSGETDMDRQLYVYKSASDKMYYITPDTLYEDNDDEYRNDESDNDCSDKESERPIVTYDLTGNDNGPVDIQEKMRRLAQASVATSSAPDVSSNITTSTSNKRSRRHRRGRGKGKEVEKEIFQKSTDNTAYDPLAIFRQRNKPQEDIRKEFNLKEDRKSQSIERDDLSTESDGGLSRSSQCYEEYDKRYEGDRKYDEDSKKYDDYEKEYEPSQRNNDSESKNLYKEDDLRIKTVLNDKVRDKRTDEIERESFTPSPPPPKFTFQSQFVRAEITKSTKDSNNESIKETLKTEHVTVDYDPLSLFRSRLTNRNDNATTKPIDKPSDSNEENSRTESCNNTRNDNRDSNSEPGTPELPPHFKSEELEYVKKRSDDEITNKCKDMDIQPSSCNIDPIKDEDNGFKNYSESNDVKKDHDAVTQQEPDAANNNDVTMSDYDREQFKLEEEMNDSVLSIDEDSSEYVDWLELDDRTTDKDNESFSRAEGRSSDYEKRDSDYEKRESDCERRDTDDDRINYRDNTDDRVRNQRKADDGRPHSNYSDYNDEPKRKRKKRAGRRHKRKEKPKHEIIKRKLIDFFVDFMDKKEAQELRFMGDFNKSDKVIIDWFTVQLKSAIASRNYKKLAMDREETRLLKRICEDSTYELSIVKTGKRGRGERFMTVSKKRRGT